MQDELASSGTPALTQWADDLACPVCFARLRFSDTTVDCTGCARIYPVVDGIPVLLAERAAPAK